MSEFKKYRRTAIAEMRDLDADENMGVLIEMGVSVSDEDRRLEHSEFIRGKVARNPKNHKDQWYINPTYVKDNFEPNTRVK